MATTPSQRQSKAFLWILLAALIPAALFAGWMIFRSGPKDKNATPNQNTVAAEHGSVKRSSGSNTFKANVSGDWKKKIENASGAEFGRLMDELLKSPKENQSIIEALMSKWLEEDVTSFLAYLDNSEDESVWEKLAPAMADILPNVSDKVASNPSFNDLVEDFVAIYATVDAEAALKWTREWLVGEAQESALASIAGELAKTQPQRAFEILKGIKTDISRMEAIAGISDSLAQTDPQSALNWASGIENESERKIATENVLARLALDDPAKAAGLLQNLADSNQYALMSGLITSEWAEKDPSAAMQWAQNLPDNDMKQQALQGVIQGWAVNDPKAAFEYYRQNMPNDVALSETIFESWASSKPTDALKQIQSMDNPLEREHAIAGLVRGWFDSDASPNEITDWIGKLANTRERDIAARQVVSAVGPDDPEPAWDWAKAIQDPQIRREALQEALLNWSAVDTNSARTALDQAKLTEDEKRDLRRFLNSVADQENEQ